MTVRVETVSFTLTISLMRKQLTEEEFYNAWLVPCHGITVQWLIDNEPELIKTTDWYRKYAVTEEQYNEWYEWAIQRMMKHYKWSRKMAVSNFTLAGLNVLPSIKKDAEDI